MRISQAHARAEVGDYVSASRHLPPGPRLAGPPLSVCDVATHHGRDTGDDRGELYVAPEVSGSGSSIRHLLAGGSHVAHADANEG